MTSASTSDCFESWAYPTLDEHLKIAHNPSVEGGGLDTFQAYSSRMADKRRSVRMRDGYRRKSWHAHADTRRPGHE